MTTTTHPGQIKVTRPVQSMKTFMTVWAGQLVSIIGSGMTQFALGIFVFQMTDSAMGFALVLLTGMLPKVLVSPIAGVLADRLDRRSLMIASDIGAALTTLGIAGLLMIGQIEIWHIYLATALGSVFTTLQVPAHSAATTSLVPKEQLGRASGLAQLSGGIGHILSPLLGGVVIGLFGLKSVLLIDLATFTFALFTLSIVRIPMPARDKQEDEKEPSLIEEGRQGWRYIVSRPGLMGLLITFAVANFFIGNAEALLTPMVLRFANPDTLGQILSVGGIGMLVGSILMSLWGGGKRKVYAFLGAYAVLGLAVLVAGLAPTVLTVGLGIFIAFLSIPIAFGAIQTILRLKVPQNMQGRVFSLQMMLNTAAFALAFPTGGFLADRIFEPLMAEGGALASSLGNLIGAGPGRGMGLMFILMGFLAMLVALAGFANPRIRQIEEDLSDQSHETTA